MSMKKAAMDPGKYGRYSSAHLGVDSPMTWHQMHRNNSSAGLTPGDQGKSALPKHLEGKWSDPKKKGNAMPRSKSTPNNGDWDQGKPPLSRPPGHYDESSGEFSSSPHGTMVQKPRPSKALTGFLFGNNKMDKPEMMQLQTILQSYTNQGLPSMPQLLSIAQPLFSSADFELETSWREIVTRNLDEVNNKQQEAMWELLDTEVKYIKSVGVITDVYMCCLLNVQNEQLLNEIDTEKLFSNIQAIVNCNSTFWVKHLSSVATHSRTTGLPLDPSLLGKAFEQFEELFAPYTKYCLNQVLCLDYMKASITENVMFKGFVDWAESIAPLRLKLTDLLVTPMQRLCRYHLLLKAILKHTDEPGLRKQLQAVVDQTDQFAKHVDTILKQQADLAKLKDLNSRLEAYDVVDTVSGEEATKLISEYSHIDVTRPMPGCSRNQHRQLMYEGPVVMKEGRAQKAEVYCLLFTDMLLVAKSVGKKGDRLRIIRPPLRLDRIVTKELRDGGSFLVVSLNEYHLVSSAYTFFAEPVAPWVKQLTEAAKKYEHAKNDNIRQSLSQVHHDNDDLATEVADTALLSGRVKMDREESVHSLDDHFIPNKGDAGPPDLSSSQHSSTSEKRVGRATFYGGVEEDDARSKLQPRRGTRGEKRYHTADAIQDIKNKEKKAAAIQKRLSWNHGNAQMAAAANDPAYKPLKAVSQDSMQSSSGFSSAGSLHRDSEIYEESEDDVEISSPPGEKEDIRAQTIIKAKPPTPLKPSHKRTNSDGKLLASPGTVSSSDSTGSTVESTVESTGSVETVRGRIDDDERPPPLPPKPRDLAGGGGKLGFIPPSKSKSLSDLSVLSTSKEEVQEGIGGVGLPAATEAERGRVTRADLHRMKILLLAGDASEV